MKPKSRRRSAILIWGLLGGLVLLALWGYSLVWRNRFTADAPATWRVQLGGGVLALDPVEGPDWFLTRHWRRLPGWTCEEIPAGSGLWARNRWMPEPHYVQKSPIAPLAPASGPSPATGSATLDYHLVQIPLWQILTLHIALCWIAFTLRQRRLRREWQRQQAAGDPQLLETS